MADKYQYFDGKKFTRDDSTGYYLCSTKDETGARKRMHVYVWEHFNGPVPNGYHVHHLDENRGNNAIENLALLSEYDPLSLHGKENAVKNHERIIRNLDEKARPRASEWHGSEAGKQWHRIHYASMKNRLHIEQKFLCEYCGKEFKSMKAGSRFCSPKCKSAWRRNSGIDDVTKVCQNCGGEYTANKYQKTKFCPICKAEKRSDYRNCGCLQHGG